MAEKPFIAVMLASFYASSVANETSESSITIGVGAAIEQQLDS